MIVKYTNPEVFKKRIADDHEIIKRLNPKLGSSASETIEQLYLNYNFRCWPLYYLFRKLGV